MSLGQDLAATIARLEYALPIDRMWTIGRGKTRDGEPPYAIAVYRSDDDGLAEVNAPEFVHESNEIEECVDAVVEHFRV